MKAPKRYKTGGPIDDKELFAQMSLQQDNQEKSYKAKKTKEQIASGMRDSSGKLKVDTSQWNPALVDLAVSRSKQKLPSGSEAFHSGGGEAFIGTDAAGKPLTDWAMDSRFKLVSGEPGKRIFESSTPVALGKNDSGFPGSANLKYVETLNPKTGKTTLMQVPTATYVPSVNPVVGTVNKTTPPAILNAGTYEKDLSEANKKAGLAKGGEFKGEPKFKAPANAEKVNVVPGDYNKLGVEGNKTYYDKKADTAISGGLPGSDWEKSIIKRLESGVSPESLAKEGHISPSQVDKYKSYYKPIYTEQAALDAAKKGVPLDVSSRIDRKEVFGQPAGVKAFSYPDVNAGYSQSTTRYFDSANPAKEIDISKLKYDDKGNPIHSYIDSKPGVLGTVKDNLGQNIGANDSLQTTKNSLTDVYSRGFKRGGIIKKYVDGTDPNGVADPKFDASGKPILTNDLVNKTTAGASDVTNKASSGDTAGAIIAGGGYVTSAAGDIIDAKSYDPATGMYQSKGAAAGSGALKGAGTGAGIGASIGTALGGPVGTAIGAGAGAVLGAGVGATAGLIKQNKAEKAYNAGKAEFERNQKDAIARKTVEDNTNKEMLLRQSGYAKGGYVHGPGTGTSDSVDAKIKPGSFITPAKNAPIAEKVLKHVEGMKEGGEMEGMSKAEMEAHHKKMMKAPNMKKKADLDEEDGEKVKLSKGEFVFTPEQRKEIISELGEDVLEALAPDAEHGEDEMKNGGLTAAKAKIILHDGTIRGKAITDKQRKYFGAIANGYECGGSVKKMATGGEVGDGEKEKLAKQEADLKKKEDAANARLERDKKAREAGASAYDKAMESQAFRLKAKKELDAEVKRLEREYKAKKDSYDQYSKDQESLKNRKVSGGYRAQNDLYNEKEVIKKKKELLDLADQYKKNLDENKKKLDYWSNDSNFNIDGTPKKAAVKTGPSGIDYLGTSKDKQDSPMVTKTGAEITAALPDNSGKVKTAPKVGKKVAKTTTNEGPVTTLSTQSPIEKMTAANSNSEVNVPKSLSDPATTTDSGTAGTKQRPSNSDLLKAGLSAGERLSGLTNYLLPYKQAQMGRQFLASAGPRPKDKIDPDFLKTVQTAQANAKFGYSPEEQAMINQENVSALRAGQGAARLYSGGSAANAYGMSRDAANQFFGRGLQAAVAGKQLQMSKQAQANELVANKAEMSRRLFQDQMNAWTQNQQSGAALLGAGIQNMVGAQRYNQEMAFQNKLANGQNDWMNTING